MIFYIMKTKDAFDASRQMTFLLADPERRVLQRLAKGLPARLRPNHLSGLGVVGAVCAGAAYALSAVDVRWLWVASAMLVVNWFGDSLDGTLARVRKIERPRYGYYLDHIVDAFNTAIVGMGIGFTPFVRFDLALGVVIVYLVLSINVYLESNVFGVFKMAYGKIGPTEGRLMLILANTLLAVSYLPGTPQTVQTNRISNAVVAGIGLILLGLLTARFVQNLQRLTALEPQQRPPHG